MPVLTQSSINGNNMTLFMEDEQGNLIEISGSTNKYDISIENKIGEFYVFGQRNIRRVQGKEDGTVSFSAVYTTAYGEAKNLIKRWRQQRGLRRIVGFLPTLQPGADKFSGNFFYKTIKINSEAEDPKPSMLDMELVPDGDVVWDTLPSS
jgi:hypothetical protein